MREHRKMIAAACSERNIFDGLLLVTSVQSTCHGFIGDTKSPCTVVFAIARLRGV